MKPALTRLALLLAVSLMLCVAFGSGLAVARKHTAQPTNPAQQQYVVHYPTIHGPKHHKPASGATKHHKPTSGNRSTTSTATTETPSQHGGKSPGSGKSNASHKTRRHHRPSRVHHKRTSRRAKRSHQTTAKTSAGRRTHLIASKSSRSASGLTVAAATGSGGGMGVWLLVILILVLVSGSVFGILRYRRSR